jgi:daunorubicin resistance ABC transporter membrane protein
VSAASAWSQEVGLAACLWKRELLRVGRERARWAGALAQPLLFWLIIGGGLSSTFRIEGAEGIGSLQFFFPGILAMIVLFTTIFATISVIEDRQGGFLQSVLVAPGSRLALVAGKVAGVTTLALAQGAIFLALAPFAGFPLGEVRWGALLAVALLACIGMTAMNFTVAWVMDSVQAYHAIMMVVLLPLWFLSGAMFPAPRGVLGVLMKLNPLTYAVDGFRQALAPGGMGVRSIPLPIVVVVLALYSVAMLGLASFACRRKGSA